jgi:pilus assembly protein CpaF
MTGEQAGGLRERIVRRLMKEAVESIRTDEHVPPKWPLTQSEADRLIVAIDDELKRSNRVLARSERRRLYEEILAEHSPLQEPAWLVALLVDETVREIIIIGPRKVIVRRNNDLTLTSSQFHDELHLLYVLNLLLGRSGNYLTEHTPAVCAILPDQSEIVALIPPITEGNIFASIRIV